MGLTLAFSQVCCKWVQISCLGNWELWFSCCGGAWFLMKAKMHRDDGASNWQNYELRNDLWVIWNFLFRGNPLSSGEYIQVVHEKNIPLSEKVFITFHNCRLPFNKIKEASLLQLWKAQCLVLPSFRWPPCLCVSHSLWLLARWGFISFCVQPGFHGHLTLTPLSWTALPRCR